MEILKELRSTLTNGKLKEIKPPHGDNIVVTCPFHSGGHEARAACNIFIGDSGELPFGYFRCFVCNEHGTFDHFVAGCFGCSDAKAREWLITNFEYKETGGVSFASDIKVVQRRPIIRGSLDSSVFDGMQTWCPYMAKRGLSRETCEAFNLHYDPKYRQIIFPYYNEQGNLRTLLKRSIDSKTFYIEEGIEKPTYGIDKIVKNNITKCIITEGLFDCLLANQYGFPAIATLGDPADNQFNLINHSCLNTVYLMFDNDYKGNKFRELFHKKLSHRFFIVDVQIENPYKDIGELDYDTFWSFIQKAENN